MLAGKKWCSTRDCIRRIRGLQQCQIFRICQMGSADAIIITHAHQDHIGSLPALTRQSPDARVFMTEATNRLANVMLHNSVNVMTRQREEDNITAYPLFTHRGVELSTRAWNSYPVGKRFNLQGERSNETPNRRSSSLRQDISWDQWVS